MRIKKGSLHSLLLATLAVQCFYFHVVLASPLDCWADLAGEALNPPEDYEVRVVVRVDWGTRPDLETSQQRSQRLYDIRSSIEHLVNERARMRVQLSRYIEVEFLEGDFLAIDFPSSEAYQEFFLSQRFYDSSRELLEDFPIEVQESRTTGGLFGKSKSGGGTSSVKPFVNGEVNSSDSIARLEEINGEPIASIEELMRPGTWFSEGGFLGANESLLDVLQKDNVTVVERFGLTHQEIARHLQFFEDHYKASREPRSELSYQGRSYLFEVVQTKGRQYSPFRDNTWASAHWTITNLSNGKSMSGSFLHIPMIRDYGFYEGSVPFRLAPEAIVEVFDFLGVQI